MKSLINFSFILTDPTKFDNGSAGIHSNVIIPKSIDPVLYEQKIPPAPAPATHLNSSETAVLIPPPPLPVMAAAQNKEEKRVDGGGLV